MKNLSHNYDLIQNAIMNFLICKLVYFCSISNKMLLFRGIFVNGIIKIVKLIFCSIKPTNYKIVFEL